MKGTVTEWLSEVSGVMGTRQTKVWNHSGVSASASVSVSRSNGKMNACDLKNILAETFQKIPLFCLFCRGRKSLCALPPGLPPTHNAVLLFGNKYPKDNSEAWQRMKMKRRVGAWCASERGHGSAGSAEPPRCWMVFDVGYSDWAWFLMLCNFEDGVFEVMHELDSFPASSWFVFVFFTTSFFSQRFFFFLFPMRGTSYVFEVKECFKGICRSAHCGKGLCCTQPLIVSLK